MMAPDHAHYVEAMDQRVSSCEGPAGEEIAFASVGEGSVLVLAAWWTSHLELDWQNDELRDFILRLAESHTVVRYDRPGVGMSGREARAYNLATEVGHLEAVIEAIDAPTVDLLGISCGGPPCVALAAQRPDLINRMVFFGSYADGNHIADVDTREAIRALVAANWGLGSQALTSVFLPDSEAITARRFTASQRHTTSADVAANLLQLTFDMNVAGIAETAGPPSLVLHRERDNVVALAQGKDLADRLPNAKLKVTEGRAHLPWAEHGVALAGEIAEFLTDGASRAPVLRRLATVVFTDIVGSTSTMQAVGDERWRDRLDALTALVHDEAESRGGAVVKDLGDGALVTLDLPSDGIAYAVSLRSRARDAGIDLRTGVHTGEIELRGKDITGRAVVVAARLCDRAASGQILASSITIELAVGRGFRSTELGSRSLKGIDGEVAVFDVEPRAAAVADPVPRFVRAGTTWTASFQSIEVSLPHTKGIADLATLTSSPGVDLDVVDLMDGPDAVPRSTGDDMLDEQAISAYRSRLGEIERGLDDSDATGDSARSDVLEREKSAILDELRTATGLGRRARRMGDDVERARKAVSARIRDAITKIDGVNPTLGNHLAETVTTGRVCRYR
jgi:class 3 adenylate cyclase